MVSVKWSPVAIVLLQELLTQSLSVSDQATTQLQGKLTAEELALFEGGRQSVERFDSWRARGVSAPQHRPQHKRKAPSTAVVSAADASGPGKRRQS